MTSLILNPIKSSSRLILLGPPCCGKGTLAQRLVRRFTLGHISTGEIFRSHLNDKTPFGEEIEQCMQEGKLIPDPLVTNLTLRKLRQIKSGFILDGFPRTLVQAQELQKHFDRIQVYHLHVEDEIVIQRLSGRLSCGSCGSVFNIIFCPPKKKGFAITVTKNSFTALTTLKKLRSRGYATITSTPSPSLTTIARLDS